MTCTGLSISNHFNVSIALQTDVNAQMTTYLVGVSTLLMAALISETWLKLSLPCTLESQQLRHVIDAKYFALQLNCRYFLEYGRGLRSRAPNAFIPRSWPLNRFLY